MQRFLLKNKVVRPLFNNLKSILFPSHKAQEVHDVDAIEINFNKNVHLKNKYLYLLNNLKRS